MSSAAPKRMRDQRPSKEERERALNDAFALPGTSSRAQAEPAVETAPVPRPAIRRSRTKYAA